MHRRRHWKPIAPDRHHEVELIGSAEPAEIRSDGSPGA